MRTLFPQKYMKANMRGMMLKVIMLSQVFIQSMMATMPTRVIRSAIMLAIPPVTSSVILSMSLVALETMLPTSRFA